MTATLPDLMPGSGQAPISIADMVEREKLVPVEQARGWLQSTEPLTYRGFDTGPAVRFKVSDGWDADEFAMLSEAAAVPVSVTLTDHPTQTGTEYTLTKGALLEASKFVPGMGKTFVANAPTFLVEDSLNHWFRSGALDKSLQLMAIGEVGHAIVRESLTPFSNVEILDRALAAIEERSPGAEVYVDATKFAHSLSLTHLQLVVPALGAEITGTGSANDVWWAGVQLTNSLAGETQTGIDGFLFRQLCTNGMIERSDTAASWSRRGKDGNSPEDVYEWARKAVDDVFAGMESSFAKVQALTEQSVEGEVNAAIRDIFEAHRIPQRSRERILEQLVESDQLTMYAITNAVTQAANTAASAREQQQLMRAGGEVVEHADRCDACHRLLMA